MGAIGIAEQCKRPGFGDYRPPASDDLVERLVPADWCEPAFALGADPVQRRREALGRVDQLGVAVDLSAGKTGGEGLIGVALDPDDPTILDICQQRAHVGTVVRANHSDRLQSYLHRKPRTANIAAASLGPAQRSECRSGGSGGAPACL